MFATFSTLERDTDGPSKPKRRQVLRACEGCRIKRTKCDDATPCSTCLSRNWVCSRTRSTSHPTSLASALIQLSTLEERIRVLESQPPRLAASHGTIEHLAQWKHITETRRPWWSSQDFMGNGSDSSAYFGPLSTPCFIACFQRSLNSCPDTSPMQRLLTHQNLPSNCRQPRDLSETNLPSGSSPWSGFHSEIISKTRQWHYVHRFWHLYHPLLPILCERDFTDEFESLWTPDTTKTMQRTPSALVDIVIAICSLAQSSRPKERTRSSYSPRDTGSREWTHETISVWHYRRCKRLLDDELEMPTLATVQSHIVMSLYLYTTSRPSAAYNSLGTAGRIAYSLGLQRDPPATLGVTKQELRRRIWWSLYIFDSRLSLELGRPTIMTLHVCDCQLPADDVETAQVACLQPFSSTAEVTWLTYTVQLAKLVTIVQSIYADIYGESSTIDNHATLSDGALLAAASLEKHLHRLYAWADAVPHDLRLSRTGGESALSYKFSGIQVDLYAPGWLQNQRAFLEALYHDAAIALIRPMALLRTVCGQPKNAIDSLLEHLHGHANVAIHVCHQLYLETDVLSDHPELSSVVWNAAVTMLYRFITGPGEHDVARSLELVVELLEHVDGVDVNAIHALANVHKASFLGQWTPESLVHTESLPANQSPTLELNTPTMPHGITDDTYSSTEVGHPLPIHEVEHSIPEMNPDLWLNDTTWLGE